jgi:hypothetical protein
MPAEKPRQAHQPRAFRVGMGRYNGDEQFGGEMSIKDTFLNNRRVLSSHRPYDGPEFLLNSTQPFCLTGADAKQGGRGTNAPMFEMHPPVGAEHLR